MYIYICIYIYIDSWCVCCDIIATAVQAMGGASAPSAPAPNKAGETKHTSHCEKPTWAKEPGSASMCTLATMHITD